MLDEANDDARSRRSVALSKATAALAASINKGGKDQQSAAGGNKELKERLLKDFGIQAVQDHLAQQQFDQISQVSALDSEIDEWAALNKYAILKDFEDKQDQRAKQMESKKRIREELEK